MVIGWRQVGSKEKEVTTARSLERSSESARQLGTESWARKGREASTRGKRWSKEEMGQGQRGRRWVSPEFQPGAELEESWRTTLLWPANVSGPPKGTISSTEQKRETRWILFRFLFLKRSHLIFRLIQLWSKSPTLSFTAVYLASIQAS